MTSAKESSERDKSALAATISSDAIADTIAAPLKPASAIEMAVTIASPPVQPSIRHEGATAIGRFLLLRKLGEGGMGEVFSGYDEQLDRKVAIKLLHAAYAPEETQKRMLREAQALARLSHPNVVAIHEVGQLDANVFVVMEHIDGMTLREWQDESPRSVDEILRAYEQAGHGLAAVHAAGMVHRDFKPHNAMIDREKRVRLLDFGLAHARGTVSLDKPAEPALKNELASQLTADGAISGTPAYMSPEQFAGDTIDARSDQFSFCVALYEALYNKLPVAEGASTLMFPGLSPQSVKPPHRDDVPDRITELLVRGLSWERDARFPDMNALLEKLDNAPEDDRSKNTRQRMYFGLLGLGVIGAWHLVPNEYFENPTIFSAMLIPSLTLTVVVIGGAFIFRHTLLKNAFHRQRIILILVMSMFFDASRIIGILHDETMHTVALRDMFVLGTGITGAMMMLVPRVAASWVTMGLAMTGIVTAAIAPQYLAYTATFSMNLAFVGYLIAWHRSSRVAPEQSASTRDGTISGRSKRTTAPK